MKKNIKENVVVDLDNDNYSVHHSDNYRCDELIEAYKALDRLNNGLPTCWDGVGWDGDNRNQYGKDQVRVAIWATLDELEELED